MSSRPTDVSDYGERLYGMLEPMQYSDPANGWHLLIYIAAIGEMFKTIDGFVRDTTLDGKPVPGWSVIVDLDRAPSVALPWLAQFVGVAIHPGFSDADQRTWIRETSNMKRGTRDAMIGALKPLLTGKKTVLFRERYGGPYKLTVVTRWAETPDQVAALAALVSQKPAGLILDYHTVNGRDFQEVKDDNATFTAAKAAYANFDVMRGADITAGPPTTPLAPQDSLAPSETLTPGG